MKLSLCGVTGGTVTFPISYNPTSQGFIQRPPPKSLIWAFIQTHLKSRRLNEALHHQTMNGGTNMLFPGNLKCLYF